MIDSPYLVRQGEKISLDKWSTTETKPFSNKEEASDPTKAHLKKLSKLQEVLYAQVKYAVLIVFQAMDGGGKDGAVDHVFSGVNPQGCDVTSFKVPTPLEASHDFLWREHKAVPARGMIGIFNRSHYESVLVERVHKMVPEKVWKGRYQRINEFESLLASEGTVILKFFLHISWEEQKARMEARLADPHKNWKFSPGDLKERERWPRYMEAYEEALSKCSTKHAPWFIVPSDHKWYRNWVVSDTIVRTLKKLKLEWPPPLQDAEKYKVK